MSEDSLLNACRRAVIHYCNNLAGETPPVYVGIDPGATGAVALLIHRRVFVGDIPTLKVKRSGGTKTEMNLPAIVASFRELKSVRHVVQVAVEQAQIQIHGKGANAYNGFRIGTGFGIWLGILATLGLPYARVAPVSWKKAMKLTNQDKEASRLMALEMFPNAATYLARKKDHDRSEAILLAEYHRRRLNGG